MLPVSPGPYTWQVNLYDDGKLVDVWDCLPEMIVSTEVHQHSRDDMNLSMPCEFEISEVSKVGG
jgi:hypothetical protein